MPDAAPKKRPWFQFHLSTAAALMFVAGGLMWANMRDSRYDVRVDSGEIFMTLRVQTQGIAYTFGWPVVMHEGARPLRLRVRAVENSDQWGVYTDAEADLRERSTFDGSWRPAGIALNLLAALAILLATAVLLEWGIRRQRRTMNAEQ